MEDGGWRMEDGRCLIPSSDILREVAGLRRKMGSAEVSGEYIYLNMLFNFFEGSQCEFQIGIICSLGRIARAKESQQTHQLAAQ
jgi:hypothetical protein